MAVNYNILNKISDKCVEEMYYYCVSGYMRPKRIKGKSKEEVYIKIFKYDDDLKSIFLSNNKKKIGNIVIGGLSLFEVEYRIGCKFTGWDMLLEQLYEELESQIPNIDEIIIEYMDKLIDNHKIMIGKFNELEEIK